VTSVGGDEPLRWGLEAGKIALPTVLLCSAEMARAFGDRGVSPDVLVLDAGVAEAPSLADKLAFLEEACAARYHGADCYYWAEIDLLSQHLSFEFLYSDLLARALARFAAQPVYFAMPGYHPASFFGGPKLALRAAGERDPQALFETTVAETTPAPLFRAAFGLLDRSDLNLHLARVIEEPVLHVAGDSHIYNCFTPNAAVGRRANVLMKAGDVCATPIPYAYQFSHHLGGRTMHHAGRPGALRATAAQCGVKDGDAVAWVFGEIDVRCHVVERHEEDGRTLDEVVETLARDYVEAVREVERNHRRLRSVVFAPIPPLDNPRYESVDLPVRGSIEQRIAANRRLRAALRASCKRRGIGFLDVAERFETGRGVLRWELSDQFCHISSTYQGPILEGLYALLAAAPRISRRSGG
jgi:hypothetical protein